MACSKQMNKKESQCLGKLDIQTKSSSDDDVIMLGTDDSSPDDWLPDITRKLSPAQNTSRPVSHKPRPVEHTSKSTTKMSQSSLSNNQGLDKVTLSTPTTSHSLGNKLMSKKGIVGAHLGKTSGSHGSNAHLKSKPSKSLDCMAITRAGEKGKNNKIQGRWVSAHDVIKKPAGRDQKLLAKADNRIRQREREHSLKSLSPDKKHFALASKRPQPLSFSEKKGPQKIRPGSEKASDSTSSKQTVGAPLKSCSKSVKHRTDSGKGKHCDRRNIPDCLTHTSSSNDNRSGILLNTLPKKSSTLEPSKPAGKLPSKPHSLPISSKHSLSPPTGQHKSAYSHSKSNYSLGPPAVGSVSKHSPSLRVTSPSPTAIQSPLNQTKSVKKTSLVNNERETESSSVFDFDESELFEVLDSVESESVYSAYNQSDTESGNEASKPTFESDPHHPSSLIKSHTCKSPSESRVQDFTMSFVKKTRKRWQVAKKSTTLNGAKFFKHPLKRKSLLQMRKYCTLRLTRLHKTVVHKDLHALDQPTTSSIKPTAEKSTSQVNEKLLAKRKRDVEVKGSSNPAKKPKLSPDPLLPASTVHSKREKDPVMSISKTSNAKSQVSNNVQQPKEKSDAQPKQFDHVSKHIEKCSLRLPQKSLPLILKRSKAAYKGHQSECTKHSDRIEEDVVDQEPIHEVHSELPTQSSLVNNKASSVVSHKKSDKKAFDLGGLPSSGATQEKMLVSSEPNTPVSKKSLSLNRNRIHSFTEEPNTHLSMSSLVSQPSSTSSAEDMVQMKRDFASTSASQAESNSTDTKEQDMHLSSASADAVEVVHKSLSNQPFPTTTSAVQKVQKSAAPLAQEKQFPVTRSIIYENPQVDERTQQPPHKPKEDSFTHRNLEQGLETLSPRDKTYNFHLLQTIAKLSPSSAKGTDNRHTATSMEKDNQENMELGTTQEDDTFKNTSKNALLVKLPISQLSPSPTNQVRALGMSKDVAVQAESGMIVEKDVLDAYLVVKLHEAMFDMKEQLQLMETQVASIAKQKFNLEKTLESKTKYIRDMTTTGIRANMVDKGTSTDTSPLSPESRRTKSFSDTVPIQSKKGSKTGKNAGKLVEVGVQTVACDNMSVSCQTEGVVRTVPARLQTSSQKMCLFNHPDSELQIFIEESQTTRSCTSVERQEEAHTSLFSTPNHHWLSTPLANNCSRTVAVSPKVRFLREFRSSTTCTETYCAKCSTTSKQSHYASTSLGDGGKTKCKCRTEKVKVCISPPLHTSIMKVVELYFKLKLVPKEPVQERHMASLILDLQHLLMHLPIDIEPPSTPSSTSSSKSPPYSAMTTSTSPRMSTSSDLGSVSPPSSTLSTSSPPSTPGTATWVMGVKLQELVDGLSEFEQIGKEVFPLYFKAELVKLQKTVQDTLKFLTSGIQHETFTHDKSGCIVDSDLHNRPWRNHELKKNHFFRRLCLDVGIRNLVHEMRRLANQNRMGKKLGDYCSGDSDLESLFSDPPTPEHEKPQMRTGSRVDKPSKTRKGGTKVNSRKGKAKGKRISNGSPRSARKKENLHLTIPAPAEVVAESSSPTTATTSFLPMKVSALPTTGPTIISTPAVTNTPHSASLKQTSPYNKCISKDETFQVRVEELHSSLKVHSAPKSVASANQVTSASTANTTVSPPVATIPCDIDAFGGNVSTQLIVAKCIRQASQAISTPIVHPTLCPSTGNSSAPLTASHMTATSTHKNVTTAQNTAHTSVTATHIDNSTVHSTSSRSLQSSLYSALKSYVQLMSAIQLTVNDRASLQRLTVKAYELAASSRTLDMAQLFVNQIGQQLQFAAVNTLPTLDQIRGRNNVIIQPIPAAILPLPPNTLPQPIDIHTIANIPAFTVMTSMNTQATSSTAQRNDRSTVDYSTMSLPAFKHSQVSTLCHSKTQVSTAPLYTQATSGLQTVENAVTLSKKTMTILSVVPQSKQDQVGVSGSKCTSSPKSTSKKHVTTATIPKPVTSNKQVPTSSISKLGASDKQEPTTSILNPASTISSAPISVSGKLGVSKSNSSLVPTAVSQTTTSPSLFSAGHFSSTFNKATASTSNLPISKTLQPSVASSVTMTTNVPTIPSFSINQNVTTPACTSIAATISILSSSKNKTTAFASTELSTASYTVANKSTATYASSSRTSSISHTSMANISTDSIVKKTTGITPHASIAERSHTTDTPLVSAGKRTNSISAQSAASKRKAVRKTKMNSSSTAHPANVTTPIATTLLATMTTPHATSTKSNSATTVKFSSTSNPTSSLGNRSNNSIVHSTTSLVNATVSPVTEGGSRGYTTGKISLAALFSSKTNSSDSDQNLVSTSPSSAPSSTASRTSTSSSSNTSGRTSTAPSSNTVQRKMIIPSSTTTGRDPSSGRLLSALLSTTAGRTLTGPSVQRTSTVSASNTVLITSTAPSGIEVCRTSSAPSSTASRTLAASSSNTSGRTSTIPSSNTVQKISTTPSSVTAGRKSTASASGRTPSSTTVGRTSTTLGSSSAVKTSTAPASTSVGRTSTIPTSFSAGRIFTAPDSTSARKTSTVTTSFSAGRASTAPALTSAGRTSTAPTSFTTSSSINASHLSVANFNKRNLNFTLPLIIARRQSTLSTTTTAPSVTAVTTVYHFTTQTPTPSSRHSQISHALTSVKSTAQPGLSTPTLPTSVPTTIIGSSISTLSSSTTVALPLTSFKSTATTPTVTAYTTTPSTAAQSDSLGTKGNLACSPIGPVYSITNVTSPETSNQNSSPALFHQFLHQSSPPVVKVQVSKVHNGLLIKWTFAQEHLQWQHMVKRYDLYAFVCNKGIMIPDVTLWGKFGEIKPLALPMAVTLTNFAVGQRYAFAVRVKYTGNVTSCYSKPCTIDL